MLPEELRPSFAAVFDPKCVDKEVYKIVKAADRISAYVKCLEELKSGNGEFADAANGIRQSIDAIDLPEVKYFMDTFIDGFSLTLDELR